jgi:uncharacterized protein (TIGR02145 family)
MDRQQTGEASWVTISRFIRLIIAFLVMFLIFLSCKKPSEPVFDSAYDEQSERFIPFAALNTSAVTGVLAQSATSGGQFANDYGKPVTQKGVCWSLVQSPTVEGTCSQEGSGLSAFTSTLTNLVADTLYYVRAYATNADGTTYGQQLSFRTLDGRAVFGQTGVSAVTATSATATATITSDGGEAITGRGVCYATTENPTTENTCVTSGTGTGSYTVTITGLSAETAYYVRAYAFNAFKITYSEQVAFTTTGIPPTVTTGSVSNITTSGATVAGNVTAQGSAAVTARGVVWSTVQNPTVTSNTGSIVSGNGTGSFSANLTGLSPGTRYYVRTYATNAAGTSYGSQIEFTTTTQLLDVPTNVPRTGLLAWYQFNGNAVDQSNNGNNGTVTNGTTLTLDRFGRSSNAYQIDGVAWSSERGIRVDNSILNIGQPEFTVSIWINIKNLNQQFQTFFDFIPHTGLVLNYNHGYLNKPKIAFAVGDGKGNWYGNADTMFHYSSNDTEYIENNWYHVLITKKNTTYELYVNAVKNASVNIPKTYSESQVDAGIRLGSCCGFDSNEPLNGSIDDIGIWSRALTNIEILSLFDSFQNANTGDSNTTGRDTETVVVDVRNPATGRTWMDRNLGARRAATSSTDTQSYGDLYQWGRRSDGHQKRNSSTTTTFSNSDTPSHGSFILAPNSPYDWRSPQNNNLWQGLNGVNNPCPVGYRIPTSAEWETERQSWASNNASGAINSPLKLPMAGDRVSSSGSLHSVGSLGRYWSSSVSDSYAQHLGFYSTGANVGSYNRAYGYSVRCIKDAVVTVSPTVITTSVSSITTISAVSGGNVTSDGGATVTARGIVWSTSQNPTISSNTGIATSGNGTGSFSANLTGLSAGTRYYVRAYATNAAGTSYGNEEEFTTLSTGGDVNGRDNTTTVVDVRNPATGRTWMDRNLGASRAATSSTDTQAYGDLYQWGRRADGHQKRNSTTTTTLSTTDTPSHGSFIRASSSPFDWRSPQNNNLWQGVNGINNPCPVGYRIPTIPEWQAERQSWSSNNSAGAFTSPLKLPMTGYRSFSTGSLGTVGSDGYYWSSSVDVSQTQYLRFYSTNAYVYLNARTYGFAVRCLKD